MLWLLLHAYGAHDEELHVLEHGNNPKFPIMHNKENTLNDHFVTMTNKFTIEEVPVYLSSMNILLNNLNTMPTPC